MLYDLDGSRVWTIPSGSQGEFVRGSDAWWVADAHGQLVRIPLDGSDPTVISVPDAILPAPATNRFGPRILPFGGGVWITNGDDTIQFVTKDGELAQKVEVGPAKRYDGVHTLDARSLTAYREYLYTGDADGIQYRLKLDGSTDPEVVVDGPQIPFLEAAGLAWFFGRPQRQAGVIVARDEDGEKVLEFFNYPPGQSTWWTWGYGALWLTDQVGFVARIGPG